MVDNTNVIETRFHGLVMISRLVFTDGAMWRLLVQPESRANPKLLWQTPIRAITSGLPTSCPVTRRFRCCECYGDLSPTIRQNGERRAPGRVPAFVFRQKNDAA